MIQPSIQIVYLQTADPYRPKAQAVSVGLQGEDFVEITKGLRENDVILVRSKSTVPKPNVDGQDDEEASGDKSAS
jgi:HlyD family secretion protein